MLDVRGKGKGGKKDDSFIFGLSHWWRVEPLSEMGKSRGGKCGKGKSRALLRPSRFEMLMEHSGPNVKQAAGVVNADFKEGVCARDRNMGDICMSTVFKVMAKREIP